MSGNSQPMVDLFGDPVPANWGRRGRPEHVPSQQNRHKVSMLTALGWSAKRIADALFVTQPTLRKHYFSELKMRDVARDRMKAAMAMKLWAGVEAGNVGAIKEFQKFVDRNDLMLHGQTERPPASRPPASPKLGKKEAARQAANEPDPGTPLGDLMAQRQGQMRIN